jgi:methionyl-tRNA formyltransferase
MKKNILFLSSNEMGYEVFKECTRSCDANFYVMTLSEESSVVMYDGIDSGLWEEHCENVIKINSIRDTSSIDIIKSLDLDLIIMCGWRQILDNDIIEIPRLGTIGFHPSPLPIGRGPSPIINSILSGWKSSAVTMFYIDDGTDTGDIIDQSFFKIEDDDYAYDVYKKCVNAGRDLIKRNLSSVLLDSKTKRIIQDNSKATYFKKLSLRDNKIDQNSSPEEAYRKIRAFSYPYLGAFFEIGDKKIVIDKARICTRIKR